MASLGSSRRLQLQPSGDIITGSSLLGTTFPAQRQQQTRSGRRKTNQSFRTGTRFPSRSSKHQTVLEIVHGRIFMQNQLLAAFWLSSYPLETLAARCEILPKSNLLPERKSGSACGPRRRVHDSRRPAPQSPFASCYQRRALKTTVRFR